MNSLRSLSWVTNRHFEHSSTPYPGKSRILPFRFFQGHLSADVLPDGHSIDLILSPRFKLHPLGTRNSTWVERKSLGTRFQECVSPGPPRLLAS